MQAGKLRYFVTIQNYTTTQDDNGNIVQAWVTFKQVWAAQEAVKGREYFEARAINPETTVRFTIRHLAGITEDMRIKDEDGKLYDIKSILPAESRDRKIEIMTTYTGETA